ncbi:MAG: NAD(P)/FAD-dependent oxidoreductase [Bacteroidota bacterium]
MKHFLIIGGGIAGTCVASELLERNCKVTLVDSDENFSSRVAAGQINPIVFRRMTKSWRVDEFLPYARNYYENLAAKHNASIIVDKPIRRLFAHEQERDEWIKRQDKPEFSPYLKTLTDEDLNFSKAKNICGSGLVKQSFYVNSENFLSAIKSSIENHENGTWITDKIDYSTIDPSNSSWKEIQYDGIVFCDGYLNMHNPYFNFITVDQTKGEVLTVESDIYNEESLNRKCFVLPQENGQFRVGSNYEWDCADLNPTEKARIEISENLSSLVENEFKIVDQVAGIRPTTKDRRPAMGKHPEIDGFYLFNGLGAKGYLIAPLLGKEMVEFILDKKPLHEEQDLRRYC